MAKEGEEGRKRIAQITRYTTIVLGLIQATAYFFYLKQSDILVYDEGGALVFTAFVIILVLTAGAALMLSLIHIWFCKEEKTWPDLRIPINKTSHRP